MNRSSYHSNWSIGALALATAFLAAVAVSADEPASLVTETNLLAPPFEAGELKGWSLVAVGGAVGRVDGEAVVRKGGTNFHSMRLTVVNPGQRCGVCNRGVAGISVKAGDWYDLTFQARTEKRENDRGYGLTVSLESADGAKVFARTTIPEVGGDWNGYTVALHAYASDSKARLVITMSEPGTISLDDVLLMARATNGQTR